MEMRSTVLAVLLLAGSLASPASAFAALAAPGGLTAMARSTSRIDVSWNYPTDGASAFQLERSLKPSTGFRRIATVNGSARSYADTNLDPATTYYYRVRAALGSRYSRRSAVVSATTFALTAPAVTATPVRTATRTATPVRTATATPQRSATQTPARTATPVRTSTAIRTATPLPTRTPTRTATPARTATRTATPARTATRTATPVRTATRTATPVATVTPSGGEGPWARRAGGAGADATRAVAIDGRGDVVVAGSFTGTADFGTGAMSAAGGADVVVAKYTRAGTPVWAWRVGWYGLDQAFGVAIDRSANCDGAGGTDCVVVTGTFGYGVDFDPGPGTATLESAGGADVFVAKYTSAGTYLWAKRVGGSHASYNDYAAGVAVDGSANCDGAGRTGCVVVLGTFYDRAEVDGLALAGPAGVMTPFVAKYGPTGTRVWARTFGNTNEAFGRAIAANAAGEVAITGAFKGSMNFGNGTRSSFGNDDVFVAVLRTGDGSGVWSTRHGSGGQDVGYGIAIDEAGSVAVTGSFTSTSGGLTFGGASWSANGADIFVARLDRGGVHRWSRRCTGTYTLMRQGNGVAMDGDGNVLLAGHFYGSLNCGTDTPTVTGAGYADVLAAKFDAHGAPQWLDRYGRMGAANSATAIAVDGSGDQVVGTGLFQGQLDVDGQILTSAGFDDAFLIRMLP